MTSLPGPGRVASPAPLGASAALHGDLSHFAVADILHLLRATRRTGRLIVATPGHTMSMRIVRGHPRDGLACSGLARSQQGWFAFIDEQEL
jgi:hypothetical protein